MTPKQKKDQIDNLKAWAVRHGYSEDPAASQRSKSTCPHGVMIKSNASGTYRLRFQDNCARKEVRVDYSDGRTGWTRLWSADYGQFVIMPNDMIGNVRR